MVRFSAQGAELSITFLNPGPTIPLSIQRDLPRFREQYNSCHKFFTSYKGIDWLTRRANIPSTELSLPEFAQGGPPPSTQIQDLESQIAVWERRHAAEQELQKTHQNVCLPLTLYFQYDAESLHR